MVARQARCESECESATAKGMSQLSPDTGLGRESLYQALSGEANPCFATILKVTAALGVHLHAQPATSA